MLIRKRLVSFYARIDQCDCMGLLWRIENNRAIENCIGTCVVVMYEIREMPMTVECALSDTVAVNVLIRFTSE